MAVIVVVAAAAAVLVGMQNWAARITWVATHKQAGSIMAALGVLVADMAAADCIPSP